MSYRRSLLLRWTRRDHLTVLTIAVAVAFFTSTVLLVTAVSAQTTAIAAEFDSPGAVERVEDAPASSTAVYLPAGRLGAEHSAAIGATNTTAERLRSDTGVRLPGPPPTGFSVGTIDGRQELEVSTTDGPRTVVVTPRAGGRTLVPADWYVGHADQVDALDASHGYAIRGDASAGATGTPLRGALAFFVAATGGVERLLLATAGGVGLLAGGIVFSVARMTVRDRRQAIRVIRATGGTKRRVLGDFLARSALLVGVGVALGYAIGVVGTNAVVNAAVYVGLPTSLTVRATAAVAPLLLTGYGVVFAIGVAAGGLATLPVVRVQPAHIGADDASGGGRSRLSPTLLDWRVLWPSASALTVFVAIVLVLAAAGGALGPLVAGSGQTVSEPGAVHPVASSVPAAYAGVFENSGVNASAEILAFTVLDGRAVLVRGADYEQFAPVSDATLVAGREPERRHEAVVGTDLARNLDVDVGDTLTLGGSTTPAFTAVEVVGRYRASGYHDDQLLVSLPTARHLSNRPAGSVHFVRLDERIPSDETARVVDVQAPRRVQTGESVPIEVTVLNPTDAEREVAIPVSFGSTSTTLDATVDAASTTTIPWTPTAGDAGNATLQVGNETRTVAVLPRDAVTVSGLPERVPPNATLPVRVQDLDGEPANATLEYGDRTVSTGADGVARISFTAEGRQTLTVRRGAYATRVDVVVDESAMRALGYRWETPSSVTPLTQASPALVVDNPWNRTLTETITVNGPGETRTVTVEVPPDGSRRVALDLGRLSPGSYELTATVDGRSVASESLAVRGDERLASALAARSGNAGGGTGIGRAIATVFGNVQVLLAVVLVFAAAMSIAGTGAAFAYDVDANARNVGLYRTLGATRAQVLGVLVGDAARIGTVATALALLVGSLAVFALGELGVLRLFGVSVAPRLSPRLLGLTGVSCLALTVLGTVLASIPTLRAPPRALLNRGEEP